MVDDHFCSVPVRLFSGVLISPIDPKAVYRICVDHIQLWIVAVCKLHFQNKMVIIPANTQPVIIENTALFLGFHRGRCPESLEYHKVSYQKSLAVLWYQQSCTGVTWVPIEDDQIKGRPCPCPYHEGWQVSLSVRDQGRADQANWTLCRPHISKTFGTSRLSFKSWRHIPQTTSQSSSTSHHVCPSATGRNHPHHMYMFLVLISIYYRLTSILECTRIYIGNPSRPCN